MGMTPGYVQSSEHVTKRIVRRLATLAQKMPPITREWLFVHYVLLGLDMVQIGAILHKDPKTVWAWMRRLNVPTRPRGGMNKKPAAAPKVKAPSSVACLDAEEVKRLYVEEGLTTEAVAKVLGTNSANICKSLSVIGVVRRGMLGRKHSAETREALRAKSLSDGRVPYLRNGMHAMKGRVGSDHPTWKGGLTPERQAFYSSTEWKEACKAVWHRADAKCERCGKHHNTAQTRGTFHVHHIVTFMVRGLRAEPTNLALLCEICHRHVHSRKNVTGEFIRKVCDVRS